MRMRKKKNREGRLQACNDWLISEPAQLQTLKEHFPIEIEIGCGKGGFICQMAQKYPDKVFIAVEVMTDAIISALETGIGEDFNIDNLRYHKVVILSDADQDGFHIRAILLTFFYRYMRKLITDGHVFIGLPPLYKVYKNSGYCEYVYSDAELPQAIERAGKGYLLQRYKGLGEMDASQLWDTTMDPAQRTLVQVTIEDAAEAEKMITTLMGDDIDARKEYISKHANFDREDDFMKKYID